MIKSKKLILFFSFCAMLLQSCSFSNSMTIESVDPNSFFNSSSFSSNTDSSDISSLNTDTTSLNKDDTATPYNVEYAYPDLPANKSLSDIKISDDDEYYASLAIFLAEREMASMGFKTFKAYAAIPYLDADGNSIEGIEAGDHTIDDRFLIVGLAFTDESIYSYDDENTIYSCGFMQICEDDNSFRLTEDIAGLGIAVTSVDDDSKNYIIESNTTLDGFSGVSNGTFFSYKQTAAFTIDIVVKDATGSIEEYADEDLDLYDYDNDQYLYQASIFNGSSIGSFAIYGANKLAYENALAALDYAIKLQDENGMAIGLNSFLVFSMDAFNGNLSSLQDYVLSMDVELKENQYILATSDGYSVVTDYNYGTSSSRQGTGLIKTLTSLSMIGAGFLLIISTGGMATPLIVGVTAATATSSLVYGASELIEGLQMVMDNEESYDDNNSKYYNPLKVLLAGLLGSEEAGEKAYSIGKVLTCLTAAFIAPVNTALSISQSTMAGSLSTIIKVVRAVAVHTVKLGITAFISLKVANLVNEATTDLGFNEIGQILTTYGATMLAAFIVYNSLDAIDQALNLSGFNSGTIISRPTKEEINEAKRQNLDETGDAGLGKIKIKKTTNVDDDNISPALVKERNYYSQKEYANDLTDRIFYETGMSKQYHVTFYGEDSVPSISLKAKHYFSKASLDNEDSVCGFFDPYEKKIYINYEEIDGDGILLIRTVAHLMRHAYQFECADFNSPILKSLRKWNYVTPDESISEYLSSAAEEDANNYADYIEKRARYANAVLLDDSSVEYVENLYSFSNPSTMWEE